MRGPVSCDSAITGSQDDTIPGQLAAGAGLRFGHAMRTGPTNLLTDVTGLLVGHAHDASLASGATAILFEEPAVASVAVVGGAPGGRDLGCLEPHRTVAAVDAIVLSGGSAFGLDAASGAQAWLRENGRGLLVRDVRVPIVPSAILFDLLNGGDKDWGRYPPYRELGYRACEQAAASFGLGTVGAGYGATTANLKGGIGSASIVASDGSTIAALAAVNAIGSAVMGSGPHFWAAPFERDGEFGGLGWPGRSADDHLSLHRKGGAPATTLAIVATDASLDKSEAKALALAASGGLAKALRIAMAPMDGDTVFAVSTRKRPRPAGPHGFAELSALGSDCLARAIARGVHAATRLPHEGAQRAWSEIVVRTDS